MKVNVITPLQSCEDCKWFNLDVDEAYMDGMPYPLWRCRYHAHLKGFDSYAERQEMVAHIKRLQNE